VAFSLAPGLLLAPTRLRQRSSIRPIRPAATVAGGARRARGQLVVPATGGPASCRGTRRPDVRRPTGAAGREVVAALAGSCARVPSASSRTWFPLWCLPPSWPLHPACPLVRTGSRTGVRAARRSNRALVTLAAVSIISQGSCPGSRHRRVRFSAHRRWAERWVDAWPCRRYSPAGSETIIRAARAVARVRCTAPMRSRVVLPLLAQLATSRRRHRRGRSSVRRSLRCFERATS
jgi:hypothetical protein